MNKPSSRQWMVTVVFVLSLCLFGCGGGGGGSGSSGDDLIIFHAALDAPPMVMRSSLDSTEEGGGVRVSYADAVASRNLEDGEQLLQVVSSFSGQVLFERAVNFEGGPLRLALIGNSSTLGLRLVDINVTQGEDTSIGYVQLFHGVSGAAAVDVFVDGQVKASSVPYGVLSTALELPADTPVVLVVRRSADGQEVLTRPILPAAGETQLLVLRGDTEYFTDAILQ